MIYSHAIGRGSHDAIIYKGTFQNRAVAVKKLPRTFATLAAREIKILQEVDDHPNVIRYYYQEQDANFVYIALDLYSSSLADIIERPAEHQDILTAFDPKKALRQVTLGLHHLHALEIIHRDIQPRNILISRAKKDIPYRMMISDFTSSSKLGSLDEDINSDALGSTKAMDIFALGNLYFYLLTNGAHPFGEILGKESNSVENESLLERQGEEGREALDLIANMRRLEAAQRYVPLFARFFGSSKAYLLIMFAI